MSLSRRNILKLLGGLAAGAAVSGCAVKVEDTTEDEPAPETPPAEAAPEAASEAAKPAAGAYKCSKCGYVYDPAKVDPPTPFADLPDDWKCPKCGAPKSRYKPVE